MKGLAVVGGVGLAAGFGLCYLLVGRTDTERIAQLQAEAARQRAQALAWYDVAQRVQGRVDTAVVVQTRAVTRVQRITDSVLVEVERTYPDCQPVVEACRLRIEAERDTSARWRTLLDEQKQAAAAFQWAADSALAAERNQQRAVAAHRGFRLPLLNLPLAVIGDYTPRTGNVGVTLATQLRDPIWLGVRVER